MSIDLETLASFNRDMANSLTAPSGAWIDLQTLDDFGADVAEGAGEDPQAMACWEYRHYDKVTFRDAVLGFGGGVFFGTIGGVGGFLAGGPPGGLVGAIVGSGGGTVAGMKWGGYNRPVPQ